MTIPTNLSHEEIERQIYAAGVAIPFALFTQYRDARDEDEALIEEQAAINAADAETFSKAADAAQNKIELQETTIRELKHVISDLSNSINRLEAQLAGARKARR